MKYELHHNDDEQREYYTDRYDDVSMLPIGIQETIPTHIIYICRFQHIIEYFGIR